MFDALPLPPHPHLDHYRKRAKELVKLCRAADGQALRTWAAAWIQMLAQLQDPAVEPTPTAHRVYTPAEIEQRIDRTADRLLKQMRSDSPSGAGGTLARAQWAIAREHGFASWPKFARHVEELSRARSGVSAFESAADALVEGNLATLAKLIGEHTHLVHARSTREHRSTLLHYVSANGVEEYRQRTPKNIVEIAKLLLAAGADVNAESEAYGGHSNTLGLTATSCHPQAAGVQLELLDLLIQAASQIDGPGGSTVNACLRNGQGEAAAYLAGRGAKLDLEGAAGAGRLDVVRTFFNADGLLKPPATPQQLKRGFAWACGYGRVEVVEFLLHRSIDGGVPLSEEGGETGLHWAAFGGHAEIVRMLLERRVPVNVKDDRHGGTPLGWALYSWGTAAQQSRRDRLYGVVELLVSAGAGIDPGWLKQRPEVARKVQADPRMQAALGERSHT